MVAMRKIKLKSIFANILKFGVAALLIYWLVSSGKLDFSQLSILVERPAITILGALFWAFFFVILGAIRWRMLLQPVGYQLSYWRAYNLQMTGFFFNTTMPGAVGGDLIKVFYVIRDNPTLGKSKALLSILLDRIVGLAGIFSIGLIVAALKFREVMTNPALYPVMLMLFAISLALVVFFSAALYRYKGDDPFLRLLSKPWPGFSLFLHIYEALREYRHHRLVILKTILISIVIQAVALYYFCFVADQLFPGTMDYVSIGTIFPLGMTVTALPIAPGGIGVGHVAFENLFRMVGLQHGANIFNVYTLIQLALNLLGVIPYLYLKKEVVNNGVPLEFAPADAPKAKVRPDQQPHNVT